jgi:hypothetical protein
VGGRGFFGEASINGAKGYDAYYAKYDDYGTLQGRSGMGATSRKHKVRLTYMSVAVTGVPTRNLANKKLKMREVDPSGATYSGDWC